MENQHIVKKFDRNLLKIREKISEMGDLVIAQIRDATAMWVDFDAGEVARIRGQDRAVNGLHRDIYERAEILIARRQPVAMDLRQTLAPINIAGELERIGDHAKSFAKYAAQISENRPSADLFDKVNHMSALVQTMLEDVLQAYETLDAGIAAQVRERDRDVDVMNKELIEGVVKALSKNSGDERHVSALVHLILVSRNIERVGDHIVNISRYVNQIVEGDDLKAIV